MTPAIAALVASFLLVGTTFAQTPGGAAGDSGAVDAQSSPAPGKPDIRPADRPKLRDQLLQGAINVLLNPRPRPTPPQAAPEPVEPDPVVIEPAIEVPAVAAAEPTPQAPRPATINPTPAVATIAAPRPTVAPAGPNPASRSMPSGISAPAIESDPAPPPVATPVELPPVVTAPVAAEPSPAGVEAPEPIPTLAESDSSESSWLLLALLAAAAVAAGAYHLRRARQIARTRAALSLNPSLDFAAGACSLSGLALAAPPLAIRARLDLGEPSRG